MQLHLLHFQTLLKFEYGKNETLVNFFQGTGDFWNLCVWRDNMSLFLFQGTEDFWNLCVWRDKMGEVENQNSVRGWSRIYMLPRYNSNMQKKMILSPEKITCNKG